MASDLTLTRGLFGRFRLHDDLNLRHLAALRKALEVIGMKQVRESLQQTTRLRMVMGMGGSSACVGTVFISRIINGRRVTLEYAVARSVQDQLVAYLDGYDSTYRKNGRTYLLLHPRADDPRQPLQFAEQAWHDWVVPYLAQRGMRVRVAPPAPPRGAKRKHIIPPPPPPTPTGPGSSCLLAIVVPDDESDARLVVSARKKNGVPSNTIGSSASDEDSGVMHISTEDIYSDSLHPSTPPPSRTPSPPPWKCQRRDPSQIPKQVLRLLDIKAHEDDPTEEDDEEDVDGPANFIDAEPNHQYTDFPSQSLFLPRAEAGTLDAELLAARYDQRARDEREEERVRAAERAETPGDAVSHFPPFPTLPLQGFCVAPYWEPRLVNFMTTVKGVVLVGIQGPGSRLVFYETHDTPVEDGGWGTRCIPRAAEVTMEVKEWLCKRGVWFRGPQEIPLAECRALLGFQPESAGRADTRYNCFGRLKSTTLDGIYLNDLVFVGSAWNGEIWVVPRVHLDGSPLPPGNRPPHRLWDGHALREHIPLKKLHFERKGRRCTWGDRLFAADCGLEILSMSLDHTVLGMHPTDKELELFLASKCQDIIAAFKGVTCALHEGDRVVVQDDFGHLDDAGEIVAFFERREAHQSLQMAVCLRPLVVDHERLATFDAELGMMRTQMVADMEVPKRAKVGRIGEFINETIRFDAREPEAAPGLEVALRHVRRDFRRGDIVRAIQGEYEGQMGLVIELYLGGEIEVYICDSTRMTGELKATNHEWRDHDVDPMEVMVVRVLSGVFLEMLTAWQIKLRTYNVVFVLLEETRPHASGEPRRKAEAARDRARADWEWDLMNTGRFVVGMFVRIQKGPMKHHFGVVTGYRYTKDATAEGLVQRRTCTRKELAADIRVQVVPEHSQTTLDFSIDHMVDRFSGLPLLVAVLLQGYCKLDVYEGRPETADTTIVHDRGETTGLGLTHKNLARKRIDVQVVSAEILVLLQKQPNIGNKIGVKVMKVAYTGYVRPFDRAVADAKAYSSTLEFLSLGRDVLVPMVALRPLRTTPVDGQYGEMCCISTRRCRVIVIGPNMEGSCNRIGEYTETIPELTAETQIVRVRFTLGAVREWVGLPAACAVSAAMPVLCAQSGDTDQARPAATAAHGL
ncbi:hypothetical protein K438DRAFT_1759968 [Mycena galopus ATCC 62051]|nr:hypothetical protein K438DRAFT_1759968 [Mycena galopus ATCC 62051]